jgi:hypothetical protein
MIRENNGKIYASCGDWITRFNYVKYDGLSLTLNQWEN